MKKDAEESRKAHAEVEKETLPTERSLLDPELLDETPYKLKLAEENEL